MELLLAVAAIPFGAVAGCLLGLVPGLYLAVAAALFCAFIKVPAWAALGLAAAVGANIYSKRLAAVFSPAAGSPDLASIDPGLKLTSEGRAQEALAISTMSVDAVVVLGLLAVPVLLAALSFGLDVQAFLKWVQGPVAVLAGAFWLASLTYKARKNLAWTAAYVLAGGALGYGLTHHGAVVGDVQALAPLLVGAFALPIALSLRHGGPLPEQAPMTKKLKLNLEAIGVGSLAGLVGGVAVGIGASSLASTVESVYEPEEFLAVAVAAETVNDLVALALLALVGAGRSGEAVAIANVAGNLSLIQGLAVLCAAFFGLIFGSCFVAKAHGLAATVCSRRQLNLALVIALAIAQVLMMVSVLTGLVFTGLFFVWASTRKKLKVPAQALFAPFLGIAWVHALGEDVNRWLLDTQR